MTHRTMNERSRHGDTSRCYWFVKIPTPYNWFLDVDTFHRKYLGGFQKLLDNDVQTRLVQCFHDD